MSLEVYTFVFSFFSNRSTGPFRVQGGNNDCVGICEGQQSLMEPLIKNEN